MGFRALASRRGSTGHMAVRATGLIGLALGSTVVGVASASQRSATLRTPPPVAAAELPSSDTPLGAPRGARVRPSTLGVRVFVDGRHGFALANLRRFNADYPAATVDGGRTWRVDGPHFHVAAANAPAVVTQVGAGGRSTYFAYGGPGGGNLVVVSTDRGRHWWRAFLAGSVPAVVYSGGELVAFTNLPGPGAYVSKDGGKHWRWRRTI